MPEIIFACLVASSKDLAKALVLAESIRTFAGDYANQPVWFLIPEGKNRFSKANFSKINALAVDAQVFDLNSQAEKFPFASKVVAAAAAESLADGRASQLVWMDTLSMVINSPDAMLLIKDTKLGYRPVDHLLIGSQYDEPPDPFWKLIYYSCGVDVGDIFPMITSADQIKIRPYLNAGMLVVRPEFQLLQHWRDTFLEIYQAPQFLEFYNQQRLYKIFIHQAVLAGVALATFTENQILELPNQVNYPLHMHNQFPPANRPTKMNNLISFRYERFFARPDWQEIIHVDPPLQGWLDERSKILARR
jgi:hypothetical protein